MKIQILINLDSRETKKIVINETGAILFSGLIQHRDSKTEGVSYEDDSQGNALAGMILDGKIELRFHRGFSDERVIALMKDFLRMPETALLQHFQITYQGRTLIL